MTSQKKQSPNNSSEKKHNMGMTKEEIHEKLKKRFTILSDKKAKHFYFSSYDFHDNERDKIPFWADMINYYYDSIYSTFALKVSKILDISKIDNTTPLGLMNMLSQLRMNGDYITANDLNDDNLYKAKNPRLYSSEGWGSYLSSMVKNTVYSYWYGTNLSAITTDDIYIHKPFFEEHCDNLLKVLEEVLYDRDITVITTKEFAKVLIMNQVPYTDSYLNLCLLYLSKLKRIALFKLSSEANTECIKLLKDINDSVSNKDTAIMNIYLYIEILNKKIEECQKQVQLNQKKAKECLISKMKDNAKMCLRKKNYYFKNEQHYNNVLFTLEQNLSDLKSMESNLMVKDIMVNVNKAAKDIQLLPEQMDNTLDDLRDTHNILNELKSEFKDYADNNLDSDDLNDEMEKLAQCIISEEANQDNEEPPKINSSIFPSAIKGSIKKQKDSHQEQKINQNESIEMLLAEING